MASTVPEPIRIASRASNRPRLASIPPRSELDLSRFGPVVRDALAPQREGTLVDAVGLVVEAVGCSASVGDLFEIGRGEHAVAAEVVGLRGDRTLLVPLEASGAYTSGAPVRRVGRAAAVAVGDALLGRVLDALGRPLDGRPPPRTETTRLLHGRPPSPLHRRPITDRLDTSVRAVDALLTLGRGQRIGIFAGGGVGKSTLLGMMVKNARIDVAVIGLVGERGREVEEFVRLSLGPEGLARSVVVAATGAEPPQLRARAALTATTIAEHFRDRGHAVLLVLDSVTRYAMALREIGLATGEPPTTKGYTPSVFAALPRLLERAGTAEGAGSITGLYTVLVEGDDPNDPISDAARAILDGHIVLRRSLAERGHFPAIDVPASVSRLMPQLASADRMTRARRARALLAAHQEAEDLLSIGAYRAGTSPRLDEALAVMPKLEAFLRQEIDERADAAVVDAALERVWRER